MFILTVTDAKGMTYVEAFNEIKQARRFIPPAWAKLVSPTKRALVQWTKDSFHPDMYRSDIHV